MLDRSYGTFYPLCKYIGHSAPILFPQPLWICVLRILCPHSAPTEDNACHRLEQSDVEQRNAMQHN